MIKKLRRKFVLTNMLLVTAVLLIVFSALCITNYQSLQQTSQEAMRQRLEQQLSDRQGGNQPPNASSKENKPDDSRYAMIPTVLVQMDAAGNLTVLDDDDIALTDDELNNAISQALAGKGSGSVSDPDLVYMKQAKHRPNQSTVLIVFSDDSYIRSSMTSLVTMSLLIGLGGLLAFFLVSLFLAGLTVKPVEKAWEQQRQFVADASHELKTPLTVILANTDILESHPSDTIEQQQKWVTYIRDEAERMKALVDDMLFLAKSDQSKTPLVHTELDFTDLAWSCLLPFESVAFEQGVTLDGDVPQGLTMRGDEGRIKQLLVLLIDNACKYAGENGKVTFTAGKTQSQLKFSINNTGEPIPPQQLPLIFERFYRVDESRARTKGGYGLGLSIAKRIVEEHRGKITVESSAEQGTTFTVTFPIN